MMATWLIGRLALAAVCAAAATVRSSLTRRRACDSGRLGAYGGDRPEVRALVPPSARRVLDLGCATGALGAALKRERGVEVVGVEADPAFAAQARDGLDH